MGSGASTTLHLPDRVNSELFHSLTGDAYNKRLHEKMSGKDDCVDKLEFMELISSIVDVMLSHDWGLDKLDRDNHTRVLRIKQGLEERGLKCVVNTESISTKQSINSKSIVPPDRCRVLVCCISRRYIDRVRGKGPVTERDSCRLDVQYTVKNKGNGRMVGVVMEPDCEDNTTWYRLLGDNLAKQPIVSFVDDDQESLVVESLYSSIMRILQKPLSDVKADVIEERSPVVIPQAEKPKPDIDEDLSIARHIVTLTGHINGIKCMAVTGSGIITAGSDYRIRIWNLDTRSVEKSLTGHKGTVNCMAVYGNKLYTVGSDKKIRVWDLLSGAELNCISLPYAKANTIAVAENTVFTGHHKSFCVWDKETCTVSKLQTGREFSVYAMLIIGRKLCLSTVGNAIRVWVSWDMLNFVEDAVCEGHTDTVICLASDEYTGNAVNKIFSGSLDGTVRCWELGNFGICMGCLVGHEGAVNAVVYHKEKVYSASDDKTIRIWNTNTMLEEICLTGHSDSVTCLVLHGSFLYSGSADYTVMVWGPPCMEVVVRKKENPEQTIIEQASEPLLIKSS